jgi:hypothetical protein
MPDIYVRSTDGLDADNGGTWALAKATLAGATAIDVAGDMIYLSQAHAESLSVSQTFAFAGSFGNPVKVVAVNDSSGVPATATVTTTAASSMSFSGVAYIENISFNIGTGTNTANFIVTVDQTHLVFKNCSLLLQTTSTGSAFTMGNSSFGQESSIEFKNCTFRFGQAAQKITPGNTTLRFEGGNIASGSVTPTGFLNLTGVSDIEFKDFDFSNFASTSVLITTTNASSGDVKFINCKMPSSWSANICGATRPINPKFRATMWNCGVYLYKCEMSGGMIIADSGVYKNAGATEGSAGCSWKFITNADANEAVNYVKSDIITIPNETVGAPVTVNVDVTCGVTLNDSHIWLDADFFGTTDKGSFGTNKRASPVVATTNHPTSSVVWTNGLDVKQKLQLTITPAKAGNIYVRVCVGDPSETIHVDYAAYLT